MKPDKAPFLPIMCNFCSKFLPIMCKRLANSSKMREIEQMEENRCEMNIVPVEVKAETNIWAKRLLNYCRKYTPSVAVRCSMNDYSLSQLPTSDETATCLVELPLYAVFLMPSLLTPRPKAEPVS